MPDSMTGSLLQTGSAVRELSLTTRRTEPDALPTDPHEEAGRRTDAI